MAERLKYMLDQQYPNVNANILLPRMQSIEDILGIDLAEEMLSLSYELLIELYEYANHIKDDRIRDITSLVLSEYL